MENRRHTKILNIVCLLLIATVGILRFVRSYFERPVSINGLICTMFCTAGMIWIFQIRKRLVQPDARKQLTAAAALMMFWMVIRSLKYDFFPDAHFLMRYAWYSYYIPMVLIPLMMFFSVLHIGKPREVSNHRRWNLLYIPAAVIILGILTNDWHQLAFRFSGGLENWSDANFQRGLFGYAAMIWVAILSVAALVIVFSRCAVPKYRKYIWIPMIPLAIGLFYTLAQVLGWKSLLVDLYQVPEIGCFLPAVFMESLIQVHLFPSNARYGDFWAASSLHSGIYDRSGVLCYRSDNCDLVDFPQVLQAQGQPILLHGDNTILRSHEVRGGYGYWTKDISEINRLNRKLSGLGDVLAEENAMLDAENGMAERRIRIEQQNRLYDDIARSVRPQLEQISHLLDSAEQGGDFERTMKFACILNAYVKRRSNLLLLLQQKKQMTGGELRLALGESLEYMQLYGVRTLCSVVGDGLMMSESVLFVYDFWEAVLEKSVPGADAVMVQLSWKNGFLMRMEWNDPREFLPKNFWAAPIAGRGGVLTLEQEDRTETVSLFLPEKGGWV